MRRSVIAAAVLSLSLAHAGVAVAQRLRPASTIRVTTKGAEIRGRFVVANDGMLVMETDGKPAFSVPTADITRLEVRSTHAGEGAMVLGITGLITGAALGAALVEGLCESSNCNGDLPAAMGGVGLVFGGGGALGGAIIGAFIPRWTPVDPAHVGGNDKALNLSVAPTFRTRGGSAREIGLRFAIRP